MKISVIIPFYNLAPFVRECLNSVQAASTRRGADIELEILCVDDGSSDDTSAFLDAYPPFCSLRVIHKSNGGEGSARNAGLDAATGDWVTYLDGDDLWLSNMLEEAGPLLVAHSDADIVSLRFVPFEEGAFLPQPKTGSGAEVFDVSTSIADRVLLDVGVYPTFFRRASLGDLRFSALPLGADRLYVAQCLARAKKVVLSDAVVHAYRVRAGSMARAIWTARKVMSQCDYASGALTALAESGKRIGRAGVSYLASLWLSDVPAHLRRLGLTEDRRLAVEYWIASWRSPGATLLSGRQRLVLFSLKALSSVPSFACEWAHILRIVGVI